MAPNRWDEGFFESTRGRVVSLLRRRTHTVDELAVALGLTDNAVRAHLAVLERDGMVRQRGMQATSRKPAFVYELDPEAERLFTRAYIPVLTGLVSLLAERMDTGELEALFREVGRRLASAPAPGGLDDRARAAAAVLSELGGIVELEQNDDALVIRGYSCPLADAVRSHPATCQAVRGLVAELLGTAVSECCDRGERPRCRFTVEAEVLSD